MPWCLILKKKNWLLPTYCHKSLNPHKAGCQKIRQGKFPFGFAMSVPAENIYYVQADVSFWPKKCCPQTFHIQLWFTKDMKGAKQIFVLPMSYKKKPMRIEKTKILHVLASIVATDNRRRWAARRCCCQSVVETVAWWLWKKCTIREKREKMRRKVPNSFMT